MRPKFLTAICIIGLCLAVMGGVTLIGGLGGLLLQPLIMNLFSALQGSMPPAQAQSQLQMFQDLAALQRQHLPLMVAQLVMQAAVVVLLFVTCIKALRTKPTIRKWLLIALLAGLCFELFRVYPTVVMMRETQAITARSMQGMMQGMPGSPANVPMMRFMSAYMRFVTTMSLVVSIGWTLLKVGYFGASVWYVSRRSARDYFAGHATPAPEPVPPPASPPLS